MNNCLEKINIDHYSFIPKYLQLADAVTKGIENGVFGRGTILPSLHHCCTAMDVSKHTVEKAYNTLKKRGIIGSFRGKGHYVLYDKVII